MTAVAAVDAQHVWVVGSVGTILATAVGGAQWTLQQSSTDKTLQAVYFVDERHGWAVGADGAIVATGDGGTNWAPQQSHVTDTLFGVRFVDAMMGWVVGAEGTLLATSDGGANWISRRGLTKRHLRAIWFANGSTGWVVGDAGLILATVDRGITWNLQHSGNYTPLSAISFVDAQRGWAVGANGTVLMTEDGGKAWRSEDVGGEAPLSAVAFADARNGYAVGFNGIIRSTHNGGASWTSETAGTGGQLSGIRFADTKTGWAVGDGGKILNSRDGGVSWAHQDYGLGANLAAISCPDERSAWAVGSGGAILALQPDGAAWIPQRSGTPESLAKVHFVDAKNGWAVGEHGTILATRDGGALWQPQVSGTDKDLLGVYLVDAKFGWAVGAGGTVLATRDGRTWRPQIGGSEDLSAVHFVDRSTGWAVGSKGTVLTTRNGGDLWQPRVTGTTTSLSAVYFVDERLGWAVGGETDVLATRDGGLTWKKQSTHLSYDEMDFDGFYDVFFADAQTGWVVGDDGTLLATRDGGDTWTDQEPKTSESLQGLCLVGASFGWSVGSNGTFLRAKDYRASPTVRDARAEPSATGEVDVSFRIATTGASRVVKASLEARAGKAPFEPVGSPIAAPDADGRWRTAWKPSDFNIEKGSSIDYRVLLEDGGPHLPPFLVGAYIFSPPEPFFEGQWREHKTEIVGAAAVVAVLALYVSAFAGFLLIAPASLAYVGVAPAPEGTLKPAGNLEWIVGLIRLGVEKLALPWFIRHPRVRKAWTAEYSRGKIRLADLGGIAREQFLRDPDVLDVWVEMHCQRAKAALESLELYRQRRAYISLPVRVGDADDGELVERPRPELARSWFKQPRAVVSIVGDGGRGKSSLACAFARWVLSDDEAERLFPHRAIPVFILEETSDIAAAVATSLRMMLGLDELPAALVEGLLATQRVLVVVDALSEREESTQRYVERVFGSEKVPSALIVTSRRPPNFGPVDRTTLHPTQLTGDRLIPFIFEYLNRSGATALFAPREQVQLGERVLALAERGGISVQVSPLLAKLFVDGAVRRAEKGMGIQQLPQDIPEVFIDYLERSHPVTPAGSAIPSADASTIAARALAVVSLGNTFVPGDFRPQTAIAALSTVEGGTPARLIDQLVSNGVLERRTFGGLPVLRFSLDPAAEFLAAIEWISRLGADRGAWESFVDRLQRADGYPETIDGFLNALSICYSEYRSPLSLPDLQFPWPQQEG